MTSSRPGQMVVNGKLVAFEDATTHLMSAGSRYGLNVFEGLRGYWNGDEATLNVFRLGDHLKRLWLSMKILRFEPAFTADELTRSLCLLLQQEGFRHNCHIRVCSYIEGFGDHTETAPVSYFIHAAAAPRARNVTTGIHCGVSSWSRISDDAMPPRVKTGANYVNARLARIEAKQNGYDDAILLNPAGAISEGPGAAVFMVRGGKLLTPSVTCGILESITRDTVIALARADGDGVEERQIDRTELHAAEELFLAGTAAEIIPVVGVDGLTVADGCVGPMTRRLREAYFRAVEGRDDRWRHWLFQVKEPA